MPAYILKVLAPAAQSFIRHSHATLPSAACSPISHFSPKIRKFGGESQKTVKIIIIIRRPEVRDSKCDGNVGSFRDGRLSHLEGTE